MEEDRYNEIFNYLKFGTYPDGAVGKARKAEVRQRAAPYIIQGDSLFHIPRSGVDEHPREVLLLRDKARVMKESHINEAGVHLGMNKTARNIAGKVYWKGIIGDVAKYCATCDVCKRIALDAPGRRGRPPKSGVSMKPKMHLDPVGVWKLVGMDLIGPFPKTIRGNQFICGLTDSFSEWPVAEAMPYKTVGEVASVLIRVICTYGCFATLITDQDQEYVNHLNFIICEKLSIDHEIASAYNPQTSGLRRLFNSKLEQCIAKFVNENPHDWDTRLNEVLFPYRTARHDNTGLSPFYVMFGREPILPTDFST